MVRLLPAMIALATYNNTSTFVIYDVISYGDLFLIIFQVEFKNYLNEDLTIYFTLCSYRNNCYIYYFKLRTKAKLRIHDL